MSGHSHWHSIKYQKGIADQKRGKIFSKMSREISIAAKDKGKDPDSNPSLRIAIEKAKKFNMPKDNIERAIKRGTGELKEAELESFVFEAYGPGKIALIIEGITDNKNRTFQEIKQILGQNNGKIANEGSVKWMFEKKGVITLNLDSQEPKTSKEELELKIIESGAEDFSWHENLVEIYSKVEDLEKIKNNLENQKIKIEGSTVDWVAKDKVRVEKKDLDACEKLFETLDESDDVQETYSNLQD
jgi:YebC/PmpR family DNA-binding regulatory protein